ncbi:MAG: hypothetical protein AB7G28_02695 [Pirellulales bacterium]|jgi:hypothetical protein
MSEHIAPQSPDQRGHAGHETTDASAFYIAIFALVLALVIMLSMLFLYQMFWGFEAVVKRSDPMASPVATSQIPPEPRLQAQPSAELIQLRREEDDTLRTYKWIDQTQGIVQIPIERAIDLLSERGLPEQTTALPAAAKQEASP